MRQFLMSISLLLSVSSEFVEHLLNCFQGTCYEWARLKCYRVLTVSLI